MVLELHVWGPAFSLPSIDAHCLAAIAYLQQAVPKEEWALIASSDPTLSPTNELPALKNGDIWIGGFRNIFHYIAQYSAGEWILDAGLPEQDGADCIAFSSFLEFNAQSLLDLSLYVSSQNYTSTTRPLLSKILPFPLPYLTPPSLRAAAKARTAHLALSSLDIDSDDVQTSPDQSIIPESLRRPRSTVSSLLAASPEANAQIRLDALATNFFEPLEKLRSRKQYFVSEEQFTSLDCLALGYLSLMLVPELPQPWLRRTMRKKFPGLCAWTEEMRRIVYGEKVELEDAYVKTVGDLEGTKSRADSHLPWAAPDNYGVTGVGGAFLSGIVDSLPVVGQLRRNTKMRQHGGKTTEDITQNTTWQDFGMISSVITGLGLVGGYMFSQGLISFPSAEEPSKQRGGAGLGAFGDAGAALSVYASHMDAQIEQQRMMERNFSHGEPVVEVDVEVQRDGIKATETIS